MTKISNLFKANKWEVLVIVFILAISAFLRFYKLDQYMTFLGDEGRDALVIKRILTTGDIPLIGPPTSIGNIYLGPLYYYMMAISMAIFWLNPVAPAGMVAFIGTATVGLVYYLSRIWFGRVAAVVASLLYCLSPINIIYSRSSWNPNPTPFFALLMIFSLDKIVKSKNFLWFILAGISIAFAVQMHYLALILIPVTFFIWVLFLIRKYKGLDKLNYFWRGSLGGVIAFSLLMSPLLLFDLKHDFTNYNAIKTFFTNRETTVNLNIFNSFSRINPIFADNLISDYISGPNQYLVILVVVLIAIPILWASFLRIKKKVLHLPIYMLGVWLVVGITGLSLYKQNIYSHYLGFLNPTPFLLLGASFFVINKIKKDIFRTSLLALYLIVIVALVVVNIQRLPLLKEPNNQLSKTQEISKFVIEKSDNKSFNFALIAKSNYDAAYQFYLDLYGHKPKQLPFDKTSQLFVVCEDQICQPIGHAKYEIAAFGWTKIQSEEQIEGVKVYKLIHNEEQEKQKND